MVRISPELIVQMLDKLVDNAVDFSQEGDALRFSLTLRERHVALSVHNPGPSLPEKMRDRLFDSMVSVRRDESEHLGLGLFIARVVVEGHRGRIYAENHDNGVRFVVLLPRTD
jgi:signal transduction histidine kinase